MNTKPKIPKQIKNALFGLANWISQGWKAMSPGLRYALVYFVCVIVVAGLVFWQYSPAKTLLFDPGTKGESPEGPDLPPEEQEETGSEEAPYISLAAFETRQETLALPVQGKVLLNWGEVFSSGYYSISEGVHFSGTRGDAVYAAFAGQVTAVIEPGEYQAGEVWINHGDFETRYINVEFIEVQEGDIVGTNQKIGELAAKIRGGHAEDYLIFEVRNVQGEPVDPLAYMCLDQ